MQSNFYSIQSILVRSWKWRTETSQAAVMWNTSIASTCIHPFLPEANFPPTGGDIAGRFCATLEPGPNAPSCCLPCPTSYWLFSDDFEWRVRLASYISIVSFICNIFLLATFVVLPKEKSHRHYLSIGLTSSFILIAIAFMIPLGTKPDHCYNDITPHNEKTQASCAATGVLVEVGAMGAVVWILLRSIWTLLRITIHLKHVELFKKLAIGVGVGLPILFMAVSLPITSVSYSLGNVCVPSHPDAFQTWFVWVLIFTILSDLILVGTMLFCLWRFASFTLTEDTTVTGHSTSTSVTSAEVDETSEEIPPMTPISKKEVTPKRRKHIAWKRARSLLKLQWRSILLAFVIANLAVFFFMFFVDEANNSRFQYQKGAPRLTPEDPNFRWVACLMANGGDKYKCLHGAIGVGVKQTRVEAALIVASFIGIIVFLLMVRTSMFVGWWELLRNPRGYFRRASLDDGDLFAQGGTRVEPAPGSAIAKREEAEGPHEYERRRTSDTLVE